MPNTKQHLWLIIPPCADRDDWVALITAQATDAGFTVINSAVDANTAASGKTLTLSPNPEEARKAGVQAKDVAVLLSTNGPLSAKLDSDNDPAPRHAAVKSASDLIRRGYALYPDRVFKAEDFAATTVEPFPGLSLLGPTSPPTSNRNRALKEALSIYAADHAFWGSEVFDINAKDVRHNKEEAVLDLTGRPRFLVFGPYIVMPAGRWKAVARIGFSAPTTRHQYRVDWGAQDTYTSHHFRPEREGVFQVEIEYEWDKPSASEFRLLLLEGAFDGEVTFFGVEIVRVG